MTTFLLPAEPITPIDAWRATDRGGLGIETGRRPGPAATVDVAAGPDEYLVGEEEAMLDLVGATATYDERFWNTPPDWSCGGG